MQYACNVCGAISTSTRCPEHGGNRQGDTSYNGKRSRATQAAFRNAVLRQAGHQCQGRDAGTRCIVTHGLTAHHTQRGNDDPRTGLALCDRHHKQHDPDAR